MNHEAEAIVRASRIRAGCVARRFIDFLIYTGRSVSFSDIKRMFGYNKSKTAQLLHHVKSMGFVFDETYVASGKHGGNYKVYTLVDFNPEQKKQTRKLTTTESLMNSIFS